MSQDDGTNRLDWSYSAGGKLIGFKLNGTDCYYYLYNLQGDVTGIYDADGEIVAKYVYDAWGNTTEMDGSGNSVYDENHVARLNPIRYRSYYYDSEILMYYLQSRYYAPEICRFINADALFVAGSALTGSNMFAYCGNNPVMYCDPAGLESELNDFSKAIAQAIKTVCMVSILYMLDFVNWAAVKTYQELEKVFNSIDFAAQRTYVKINNFLMINTLDPNVRPLARDFLAKANDAGYLLIITWARRTQAQQDELGPVKNSTNNHTAGRAFDVAFWDPDYGYVMPYSDPMYFHYNIAKYDENDPRWSKIGDIGKSVGFSWGGDWGGNDKDPPHFYW